MMRTEMKNQQNKKSRTDSVNNISGDNIRFIVPMPGKSNWQDPQKKIDLKRVHKFSYRAGDLALEDYQAQFLMQREYFID